MSTRCVINFMQGKSLIAKIYRHGDGYPDKVLPDLAKFFEDVKKNVDRNDTRFGDASYLAAKFIVWQMMQYAASSYGGPKHPLSPIGVGVLTSEDPGDIEHRYFVACEDDSIPAVRHEKVRGG